MRKFPTSEEIAGLPPDGGEDFNRLVFEGSLYLRQHAANPVDWYPWGDEAFAAARSQSKPIFLSVGYSTCHWCHVMEHESFEDDEIAEFLKRKFIAIKVDREERPDLDHQYMAVTQAMQGHGGWPNSLFLTPNAEPFFAFTYLPTDRFLGVLSQISELWETQMMTVAGRAADVSKIVGASLQTVRGGESLRGVYDKACEQLLEHADLEFGGFGNAPKFPHADDLLLLLQNGSAEARQFAKETLKRMRFGGIYDQLAGGFHRYSTDREWLLPHFEKMAYDQASLAHAYAAAIEDGETIIADTLREILDFVADRLSRDDGRFAAAIDADTDGEEGKTYVWTFDEIVRAAGEQAASLFGAKREGNFRDERTRELTGQNILTLTDEAYKNKGFSEARAKLLEVRDTRPQPMTDRKACTDWNGMLIRAFARGSIALNEPKYADRARKVAEAILAGGGITHVDNKPDVFLDDYAFFVLGLIELHQADFDAKWLDEATQLAEKMTSLFWASDGGFFLTTQRLPGSNARPIVATDSAHRSGYAAATLALIRLGRLTQDAQFIEAARSALDAASADVAMMPTGHTGLVLAAFELEEGREVVVSATNREEAVAGAENARGGARRPAVFTLVYPGADAPAFAASLPPIDGLPTFYICRDFACELPTRDVSEVRGRLRFGLE